MDYEVKVWLVIANEGICLTLSVPGQFLYPKVSGKQLFLTDFQTLVK
jgi:hypothetical protein